MRSPVLFAAASAAAFLCASPARAAWTVAGYDVPGSETTQLSGVNDAGVIVGYDSSGGFILDHGVVTTVVAPWAPASTTSLNGIADNGLAVGTYADASLDTGSFLYQAGTFTQFTVPGASDIYIRSISSNARYLAGTYDDASDELQGFVYDRTTGTFTQIPVPADESVNVVQGVNDQGQVVGSFGGESFIYDLDSNTEQMLAASGALTTIRLRAITGNGLLGGWAYEPDGQMVGIVGTPSGGFDTFSFGAGSESSVYGLNQDGEAVGFTIDAAGVEHGFIATSAVPEPAAFVLFAGGIALLRVVRRRVDARAAC